MNDETRLAKGNIYIINDEKIIWTNDENEAREYSYTAYAPAKIPGEDVDYKRISEFEKKRKPAKVQELKPGTDYIILKNSDDTIKIKIIKNEKEYTMLWGNILNF